MEESAVMIADKPAEKSVVSGDWFEHGGSRIWYEESGDAAGPAVVVLTGILLSIDTLAAIRAQLAAKGMRVIAADLPGSGKSLPQPRIYTADYYAQDSEAIAALIEAKSAAPAVIIGFSDGGEVALLLAATYPKLVKAMLMWGASGKIEDASVADFFRTFIDTADEGLQDLRAWIIEKYGEDGARTTTQSIGNAFDAMLVNDGDIAFSKAGQIKCPVLLLVGDKDDFISVDSVKQLNARIPNGRIMVVEGGEHFLHESHPELIANVVHTFLFANHLYPKVEEVDTKKKK